MNCENKSVSLSEQRADIFKEIYGANRLVDVIRIFEKDYNLCKNKSVARIHQLYRDYSYAIFFGYSPSSIRNNLVKFKKVIERNGGKYQAIALEAFTVASIYVPIKNKDAERKKELKRAERAKKSESHNPSAIEDIVDKIKNLKNILDNKKYTVRGNQNEAQVRAYYILPLLALSTGRRFTEILKTLKLEKRGDKKYFTGLLKGNLEKIDAHIIELTYEDAKTYLREIRRYAKAEEMIEEEVNKKYAKVFNNALKRIGLTNVKTLRHNYTVAGSQIFKREGETVEDTITRILGHREVFTSALNYT